MRGPICPKCGSRRVKVVQRMCNHSAFNGYRYTPSDYSEVRCQECEWPWRTKAKYVSSIGDDPEAWR